MKITTKMLDNTIYSTTDLKLFKEGLCWHCWASKHRTREEVKLCLVYKENRKHEMISLCKMHYNDYANILFFSTQDIFYLQCKN